MMRIAGVDEAGRGALAGPVIAAAVILPADSGITELADSKTLSAAKREYLAEHIRLHALDYAIGEASAEEIDAINILQASLLAMSRAIDALTIKPDQILIDGSQIPPAMKDAKAIIRGDQCIPAISAASILAKVKRDAIMTEFDCNYPEYGFRQHKGYGTVAHLASLMDRGPSAIHRQSYSPVRKALR